MAHKPSQADDHTLTQRADPSWRRKIDNKVRLLVRAPTAGKAATMRYSDDDNWHTIPEELTPE